MNINHQVPQGDQEIIGCHDKRGASLLQRVAWDFLCPKTWDKLQETHDPKIRFCQSCRQDVHLITTAEELEQVISVRCCISIQEDGAVLTGSHRVRT